MKNISKKVIIMILSATVIVSGCNKDNRSDVQEQTTVQGDNYANLNFEKSTEQGNRSETSVYESYDSLGHCMQWIDPDLDLEKALKENDFPPDSFQDEVVYTGKELTYRSYYRNLDSETKVVTVFMNANGNMQPFRVDQGQIVYYYTFTLQAKEDRDITFTFDPIYAPLNEKGTIKILGYSYLEKNDELISVMKKNALTYSAAFLSRAQLMNSEISIQADSEKNERKIENYKNEMGEDSPNIFAGGDENSTSGITFGEKFTNEKEDGLINLDVKWNPSDTMYARARCYGENNVRIFLFMDGELLPAFHGQYFADFYQKMGIVHNIPLDAEALPKDGKHIIQALISYEDENYLDTVFPILLEMEP